MKESDIRPQELFNRYLELARKDIEAFFSDRSAFVEVSCPACAGTRIGPGPEKLGFRYVSCLDCGSLYLSPRPGPSMLTAYYSEAESVKFWSTHFFKETAEARRQQMFKPRAQLVAHWADRINTTGPGLLVDIGSGYGIFLEEIAKLEKFSQVVGVEPAPNLAAICRQKGFSVLEKFVEQISAGELEACFATAFEVLEHLYDPLDFLEGVRRILKSGGVFLFTTLTVTGFDIQVLWEHSKSVYPPHHMNLLSVSGMDRLVSRAGFESLEVSTPGQLDVDIVRNMALENPSLSLPRFVSGLVLDASEGVRKDFQDFLARNCLSSHIRVIARTRQ